MQSLLWLRRLLPDRVKSPIKIYRAKWACLAGIHRFCTPALRDLDLRLARLFDKPGVFLEIGANDGYSQSNTFYLERHLGWSGILIEPTDDAYRICRSHRRRSATYHVACAEPGSERFLLLADQGLLTSVNSRNVSSRTSRVPVCTLSEVIDDAALGTPNLISVDVEGFELQVLAGLDLDRHSPEFLLVETSHIDEVARLLEGHLVLLEQLTHHDYLFVARSAETRSTSLNGLRGQSDLH